MLHLSQPLIHFVDFAYLLIHAPLFPDLAVNRILTWPITQRHNWRDIVDSDTQDGNESVALLLPNFTR